MYFKNYTFKNLNSRHLFKYLKRLDFKTIFQSLLFPGLPVILVVIVVTALDLLTIALFLAAFYAPGSFASPYPVSPTFCHHQSHCMLLLHIFVLYVILMKELKIRIKERTFMSSEHRINCVYIFPR